MEATAPSASATPAPTENAESKAESKPTEGKEKDASAAEPKAAAERKPEPKRYKLPKDDGTEEEVDEVEVKRRVLHAREANKRMEEAAKTRKQAEQFIEKFLDDPIAILENPRVAEKLKKPLRVMLEERLARDLRKEVDPQGWEREQQEADLKSKAQAWEDHQKRQKEEAEKAELSHLEQHYAQEYDTKLKTVLDASGLPKTTNVVRRAAQLMQVAIQSGYEPDLNIIVDQVRDEYHGDTKSLYGHLSGDQLIQLFGEEIANKIRKADLARLRKPAAVQETQKEPAERRAATQKQKLNPREFLEAAMKRAGV